MPAFPELSFLTFFDQNFVCIFHHSHACYKPCSSHPHWFDHPNKRWRVQIM